MYQYQLNFTMFQVRLVFYGNILIIQIRLSAVFINFKCVLMQEYWKIEVFLCHMRMVLARLKTLILKVHITILVIIMVKILVKYG